eukprot:354536-Chlamydomonas_euryale.AAC.2
MAAASVSPSTEKPPSPHRCTGRQHCHVCTLYHAWMLVGVAACVAAHVLRRTPAQLCVTLSHSDHTPKPALRATQHAQPHD